MSEVEPLYEVTLRAYDDRGVQYVEISITGPRGAIVQPFSIEDVTPGLSVARRWAEDEILRDALDRKLRDFDLKRDVKWSETRRRP